MRTTTKAAKLTAVDLFAGCGGLTAGASAAGFRVTAGVELDSVAAATFRTNHPGSRLLVEDVTTVTGQALCEAAGGVGPDLVMGCAPCQGFCSLTRKLKREDPRNGLLLEMARLIDELRPDAVLMENVPGLLTYGSQVFEHFVTRLRTAGYYPMWRVIQMADFGVPQYRRRLVLLAGRGFVIPFPTPTHARPGTTGVTLRPWITVREALPARTAPPTLAAARGKGGPETFGWHVVRDLQPQTKARLKAAVPGRTWLAVDESVRPACHQGGYTGFTNVYGRMAWDRVSPTITGGCTTPAKGRFGHPDRRRTTISVREAAILQSFPETYRFATDQMDAVCEMIGNAVPPKFASSLVRVVRQALEAHRAALAQTGSRASRSEDAA